MKLVVLLALFVVAQAAPDCKNPIWEGLIDFTGVEPTPTTSKLCPNVDGKSSCCTQEILDEAETDFTALREELLKAEKELSAALDVTKLDTLKTQVNNNPDLEPAEKKAIIDLIDVLIDLYEKLAGVIFSCLRALLVYTAGVFCFACDADWAQYVTINGNSVTVKMHTEVCDFVGGEDGCLPLYQTLQDFNKKIYEWYSDLGASVPQVDPCSPSEATGTTFTSSCKDHICSRVIRGIVVESDWGQEIGDVQFARRADNGMFQHASAILQVANLGRVNRALVNYQKAILNYERATTDQQNSYSNDGYNAKTNGEKSGFDTTVDSGDSSDAAIVTVAFSVFLSGIALVTLFA